MLDKTYKIEAKHQQFLNKETKKRFDEVWSMKTIAKQGDTCDNLGWTSTKLLCRSILWFDAFCMVPQHEITMAKTKAKRMKAKSNDL
jgi:hypothetical protein